MNSRNVSILVIIVLITSLQLSAQTKSPYKFKRQFSIKNTDGKVKVPRHRIWKIESLSPYESEKGVGTADLYINGTTFVGTAGAYTISGKFDISINKKQTSPLWILEDSEVEVGDSRGTVTIKEYLVQG